MINLTSFFSNDDSDLDIDDNHVASSPAPTAWLPEQMMLSAATSAQDHASDISLLDEPIVDGPMSVEDLALSALLGLLD